MTEPSWDLPYPSQRLPVLAANMVATSQPLAAQAGLTMLQRGGNAIDAAVAAAIALTVVEPTSNGIGADAFALVWDGERLHGLNASGRSPAALDPEPLLARDRMPVLGWDSVTVPGAVSAWTALTERFGNLDLPTLSAPAVSYAADGFLVAPVTALLWASAPGRHTDPAFAAAFLPGGRAPRAGERFALPAQARTLELIARSGGRAFYEGELAERIDAAARAAGAALRTDDLAAHAPTWVSPLSLDLPDDTRVFELPPNGQGLAALLALGILARTPAAAHPPDSAESIHWQAEAMKLAFADAHRHIADPDTMRVDPAELLRPARLDELAARIDPRQAADPGDATPRPGGTVYLATADAEGRMVSYIQSNYLGFGSGVVVPDTGIALQNRGAGFSTVRDHPNQVAPAKRPFHTIIPGFATLGGQPWLAFGVMGGPMQPQGHLQTIHRLLDHGQSLQAVADAPRWRVDGRLDLALEAGVPVSAREGLLARGHRLQVAAPGLSADMFGFGGAQLVGRLPGGWAGASDPRKDGQAVGF